MKKQKTKNKKKTHNIIYNWNKQTNKKILLKLVKIEANVWENSRKDQWKPMQEQARVFTCSTILMHKQI